MLTTHLLAWCVAVVVVVVVVVVWWWFLDTTNTHWTLLASERSSARAA